MRNILSVGFYSFFFLFSSFVFAAVPTWQIVPAESSLKFTATQNGAPVSGQFKKFNGEIHFDPNDLKDGMVKITVEMGSVTDPYNQLSDTLKDKDWFNTKMFPTAIFTANHFEKTGDKTYRAMGELTIKDKTLPVILSFSQETYTPTKAVVKGSTTIKRTAFDVGQGDWSDTKTVKDDVKIDFVISAVKQH